MHFLHHNIKWCCSKRCHLELSMQELLIASHYVLQRHGAQFVVAGLGK